MIPLPPVPDGGPVRISATTYMAFRQCEALAQARFEGLFPADSASSFVGILAHRLFARHLVSGPINDLAQAVREEIGSGLNAKMGALGIHRPSQLEETIHKVGSLYERFRRFPGEGFLEAEVSLEVEPVPDVILVGKVDAVFSEGEAAPLLADWKTGPLGDPLIQLFYYAYLWAWDRHQIPAAVEAVSVQTGERLRRAPTPSDLREVGETVAALITAFRSRWLAGPAPRSGGPWCRYCPLLADCPEGIAAASVAAL